MAAKKRSKEMVWVKKAQEGQLPGPNLLQARIENLQVEKQSEQGAALAAGQAAAELRPSALRSSAKKGASRFFVDARKVRSTSCRDHGRHQLSTHKSYWKKLVSRAIDIEAAYHSRVISWTIGSSHARIRPPINIAVKSDPCTT
eukprot:Skav219427  [mRNA]  locus=scaffold571:403023:403454:- [translate_table: standard]